ncbi:MAG: hypothetical protein IJH92_01895 [Mogibacterium sp.]|nr:hypothetical protein [Clostridia bacterium]MBR0307624.1 hypothetical protein [Mogibacterium sp.]
MIESLNELIIDALEDIVPVVQPDIYKGSALEYITFKYDEAPDLNGDDYPDVIRYAVQVHYCCPLKTNSLSKRRAIKQALAGLGGTYPSVVNIVDENGQEFVFSFEYADGDV